MNLVRGSEPKPKSAELLVQAARAYADEQEPVGCPVCGYPYCTECRNREAVKMAMTKGLGAMLEASKKCRACWHNAVAVRNQAVMAMVGSEKFGCHYEPIDITKDPRAKTEV